MGETNDDTTGLIVLARELPLDDTYGTILGKLHFKVNKERILSDLGQAEGKRKLALLLACIWAKCQMSEQSYESVQRAANAALELMEAEGVALDASALMKVLSEQKESFYFSGAMQTGRAGADNRAGVATEILRRLIP